MARMRMLVIGFVAVLAIFATDANAASQPAHATLTGCDKDHVTVVGAVKLSGRDARRARGAVLQMRFRAMPLFGLPKSAATKTIGKKTKGSSQETFTGLGADSWVGVMSWSFKKGRKTVLSGDTRSQPGRVGSTRGIGFCTLSEGAKPADTTPPVLSILPLDEIWHHGPTDVALFAQDDFSGVRSVTYSLDGGPAADIRNGSAFSIPTEGAHNVHWTATDVAGNTASRDAIVRVDVSAPSKPSLTAPFSVTVNSAPTFSWSASTDSGSGVKGYFLQIKRASDGSVVAFSPYGVGTTSTPSPVTLTDGETYVASVIAIDNTDLPFSAASDDFTFRVDSSPGIASSSPADGTIVQGAAKDGNLTITLDRPADKATVAASTVQFVGVDPATTPGYKVSCDASCTTITVNPDDTLAEGRYKITLSGVKSQEGVVIPGNVRFSVPFIEDAAGGSAGGSLCAGGEQFTTDNTKSLSVAGPESGTLTFDYSVESGATGGVRILAGSTVIGDSGNLSGSGHATVQFTLPDGNSTVSLQYYVNCSTGTTAKTIDVTNVIAYRNPF
jgi:Bacterial Ig-like domain